jgi:probable O-glycosylation ligase (exosortase A-associated)
MRGLVVAIIVFSALPVILARPYVGILAWSWLGYMNPHRLTWGFAYDFPFAYCVAVATFVGMLFSREPKRIPLNALTLLWFAFLVWMCITTLTAMYPDAAARELERVVKIQVMSFVTIMLITTRERIRQLVWVIVVSLGFFGIKGGVFTLLTAGAYRVWGPPGSYVEGNNEIALALLMVLPLMEYLRRTSTHRLVRLGLLGAMVLCGLSVLGSQSRGALVGGVAVVVFLVLKSRRKLVTGIALLVLVPLLVAFMPESWVARMRTIESYQTDTSAMSRIETWRMAVHLANDKPLGGGFETWTQPVFDRYAPGSTAFDAHSIYFKVLGEHGWLGLALFLAIGVLAWRSGTWIVRHAKGHEEVAWLVDFARMTQVSLAAFAAGGAFLSLSYFDLYWHLVALLVIGKALLKRHVSVATTPAATAPLPVPLPAAYAQRQGGA